MNGAQVFAANHAFRSEADVSVSKSVPKTGNQTSEVIPRDWEKSVGVTHVPNNTAS